MYRHCYYDSFKKSIYLYTWNEHGERTCVIEPFSPYLYVESLKHHDAVSVFNTSLKKMSFPNEFHRKRFVNDGGIKRIFYNIRPEQQYLIEKYSGMQTSPEFSKHPLKLFYLDIEVYSPEEFPDAEDANHPINLITVFDSITEKFYTFGLKQDYKPKDNGIYIKCEDEEELLRRFLIFWKDDYPDGVVTWYGNRFDIPYIVNRITKLFGEEEAASLSPVNRIYLNETFDKKFKEMVKTWIISGVASLDYKEIYWLLARKKPEQETLDYVSSIELGEGKNTINETGLARMSIDNWEEFVDYNLQDVRLMVKLEKKLKFIRVLRTTAYIGFSNIESAMGKIQVLVGGVAEQARSSGKIIATFVNDKEKDDFSGGFVKEIDGRIVEDVATVDANSLYPNTMITLNLSHETKLGKIINIDEEKGEVTLMLVNGKAHTVTRENFQHFLLEERVAISDANVMFTQKFKGVIPEYVERFYAERVRINEEISKLEQENLHINKTTKHYAHNLALIEQYDIQQYTLKILLNSLYGVCANVFSALYDLDLATSITHTGQAVVKESSEILNRFARKTYGINEDITVYNDTDSVHFTIKPILQRLNIKLITNDSVTPEVFPIVTELQNHLNTEISVWAKAKLNSDNPQFFFKREAICPTVMYVGKKNYVLYMRDKGKDKPLPCNEISAKGVSIATGKVSKAVKVHIRNIIESILYTNDKSKTDALYVSAFEEFKKLSIEDVSSRRGVSNCNKYKTPQPFTYAKGTPIGNRCALHYNDLLSVLKLEHKYSRITSGNKIKWCYVKPENPYGITCIGYPDKFPDEFKGLFTVDYELMFEKTVASEVERFYKCIGWKLANFKHQYECDIFEMLK